MGITLPATATAISARTAPVNAGAHTFNHQLTPAVTPSNSDMARLDDVCKILVCVALNLL